MVLVQIMAIVREDQIRFDLLLELFEGLLDRDPLRREKPVSEVLQHDSLRFGTSQKDRGALAGLFESGALCAEYHPGDTHGLAALEKCEDGSAAADFQVVGVGTQAENLEGVGPAREVER